MSRKGKMVDKEIRSEYLNETMTLRIYSPATISTSYPFSICIVQDGNDYYQMGRLATVSDRLHEDRQLHNTIFIGIHYQDRFDRREKYHPDGEQNENYIKFLGEEVIPYVDQLIPNMKNGKSYSLMGDSLAGTLALMTSLAYPDLFEKIIMQSPLVNETVLEKVKNADTLNNFKIYHTIGTEETEVVMTDGMIADFVKPNRELNELLVQNCSNYVYHELEDAQHTWKYWQNDMQRVLTTMFE